MKTTKLDTWFRRLVWGDWATSYDIRFIIRSSKFVPIPERAKGAIMWRDGHTYCIAINHTLKWLEAYLKKNPDTDYWINEKWVSKGKPDKRKGRPSKQKEPDICRERTPEEIERMLMKKQIRELKKMLDLRA